MLEPLSPLSLLLISALPASSAAAGCQRERTGEEGEETEDTGISRTQTLYEKVSFPLETQSDSGSDIIRQRMKTQTKKDTHAIPCTLAQSKVTVIKPLSILITARLQVMSHIKTGCFCLNQIAPSK